MTPQEFSAWFEGFSENIEDVPNKKQWKRIKARVKDIDGMPVTPVIVDRYIDRYVRPYYPYPYPQTIYTMTGGTTTGSVTITNLDATLNNLGRAEAKAIELTPS